MYPGSVNELVDAYESSTGLIDAFRQQLMVALESSTALMDQVHSHKSRMKDPDHLRDKLRRKIDKHGLDAFDITPENLTVKINDLAGVRLLHIYTEQIREIAAALRDIFTEYRFEVIEGPTARTWDDESRRFFQQCGIETLESETMYTSVHYVIGSNSMTPLTCEIQVRTLMEEVWGEVDHEINYPHPTPVLATSEQLKVLARATSTATRLVDSIYRTHKAALEDGQDAPRP